jgi:arginyl-tRNA synthetase
VIQDIFKEEIASVVSDSTPLSREAVRAALEAPRQKGAGDIALPCFRFAKDMKSAPNQIASDIAEKIRDADWKSVSGFRAVGPFVNFDLHAPEVARCVISSVLDTASSFGSSDEGGGRNIVIDFSSPNIAKPFGVGHLRSTVIGNVLYHVYEKLGYNCVGVNHLGDWGTQFGKMIVAYRLWGSEEMLQDNPVRSLFDLYTRFHSEAKDNPALDEDARAAFKSLEDGEPEAVALWKRFKDLSLDEFNRVYDVLNIRFDHYTGESFYNDKIDGTLSLLEHKGLTTISQEALIVDLEKFDLGACLLRKGDDATLYATRDLAGILYRHDEFDFEKCLYVVGSAQALHFKQVFKVIELAGFDYHKGLVHVQFGWIRFEDKAMSTREGNIIFLADLIDRAREIARGIIIEKNPDIEDINDTAEKIGVGAIVFSQTSVRRTKDIDFRWEDALTFDGETGPYLQYTHARLSSLKRKYGRDISARPDFTLLVEPEEKGVLLQLWRYPEKIRQAADEYEPFVISSYLIDLAQDYNTFYQKHRVISDNKSLTDARMALCEAVRIVVADGLGVLGIPALERM